MTHTHAGRAKILRVQGEYISVASESRFESEERLRSAVAAHPEVLPSEDIGLGPLVTLAIEVDFGAGPIDLLAVDPTGRLVVAEFKRGSENPDVREVVAQVLDYGSSLWRTSLDQLDTGGIVKTCGSACFTPLAVERLVDLGRRVVRRVCR